MDEILLNVTQNVSATRESPEFSYSGFNEKDLYQVNKMSPEEAK